MVESQYAHFLPPISLYPQINDARHASADSSLVCNLQIASMCNRTSNSRDSSIYCIRYNKGN